jgi:hypothetical protein
MREGFDPPERNLHVQDLCGRLEGKQSRPATQANTTRRRAGRDNNEPRVDHGNKPRRRRGLWIVG